MTVPPDGTRTDARVPTIAVVGVGAIGTVVADALTDAARVTLCRRGADRPMTLIEGDRLWEVAASVATEPSAMQPVDWVVLATKAHDVAAAGVWLDGLVGPSTRIAVLQNGIDHADRVSRWVDATRVLPAVVLTAAERTGPDDVTVRQRGALVLPDSAIAASFAELVAPRLPVRRERDFEVQSWRKLVMNAALNSVTALTQRPAGVATDRAGAELVESVLAEGLAVARAHGVPFDQDERVRMRATIRGLPPTVATSMLVDRRKGRALEHDYLTGAILRSAADAHVPVPTIRALHNLITLVSD